MVDTTEVLLIRHGETEWSRAHRHTGLTDVALTASGEHQASALAEMVSGRAIDAVWTSPLRRAADTCRLAGFGDAEVFDDLVEWDYGEYEGSVTAEMRERDPGWSIWTATIHRGETLAEVGRRADGVIQRIHATGGTVAVFAHGQFLRILASRWIAAPASTGRHLVMDAATMSVLGVDRGDRVIRLWNEACHLGPRGAASTVGRRDTEPTKVDE